MEPYNPETGESDIINLATLAEGAAVEMVNEALESAWKDIRDPNTPPKEKREVTLKLTLTPDEERTFITVGIGVDKKLAKVRPSVARVELARGAGGKVIAIEIKSRQIAFPQCEKPADVVDISAGRKE